MGVQPQCQVRKEKRGLRSESEPYPTDCVSSPSNSSAYWINSHEEFS